MKSEHVLELWWIIPAAILTLMNFTIGFLLLPDNARLAEGLTLLPGWMGMVLVFFCGALLVKTMRLMLAGESRPTLYLFAWVKSHSRLVTRMTALMFLAGANMLAFLWIKPVLNIYVEFRADPLLADLDNLIFLGRDPWVYLEWLNVQYAEIAYHPLWFALMIGALMILVVAPVSPTKTAMALTYFVLWSVAGPVLHILLPAGGPIFYERLGLGDRFAGLTGGGHTLGVSNFLWSTYSTGQFTPMAGISAMPSMHVTMAAWTVLCFRYFAPKWLIPVALISLWITLLSVSLGWHYAVDGLAGIALALTCFAAFNAFFKARFPEFADKS